MPKGNTVLNTRNAAEIKQEYESVISEQKKRILDLRDKNAELSQKLEEYEKCRDTILKTLTDARSKADEIIKEANAEAENIIKKAALQAEESEKTIKYYRSSLKDLEMRCEQILNYIQNEIRSDKKSMLSIVNQ